jgi:hypothetical protein
VLQTIAKTKEIGKRAPSGVNTLKRKVRYEDELDDGGRQAKGMEVDQ